MGMVTLAGVSRREVFQRSRAPSIPFGYKKVFSLRKAEPRGHQQPISMALEKEIGNVWKIMDSFWKYMKYMKYIGHYRPL